MKIVYSESFVNNLLQRRKVFLTSVAAVKNYYTNNSKTCKPFIHEKLAIILFTDFYVVLRFCAANTTFDALINI